MYKLLISFALLATFACSCRRDTAVEPLKFTAYEHNPVLSPGESGSWDDYFVILPQVIRYDSTFYMFYSGSNSSGVTGAGLATSRDGFHFTKYDGNPLLYPDGHGFDAFSAGGGLIIRQDSVWAMYYNGSETVRWGPGPYVGRATARNLTGPWIKDEEPVLVSGSKGEWDAGFIWANSVLLEDDGSYRMYYAGGTDFFNPDNIFIGLAHSPDGFTWKKYDDPATVQHPFTESDPVLKDSPDGKWDDANLYTAFVYKDSDCYKMYYAGTRFVDRIAVTRFGFATSTDGIKWKKYRENPIYSVKDDPYALSPVFGDLTAEIVPSDYDQLEGPMLLFLDTAVLMYYDYGTVPGQIGVAIADR